MVNILPNQKIKVSLKGNQKKYYEDLGYLRDENGFAEINVTDLKYGSEIKVNVICDYCGKTVVKSYKDYNKCNKFGKLKDCCKECSNIKNKEVILEKYGVESVMHIEEFKNKLKATNMERYGVEYISQSKENMDKRRDINFEKYGTRKLVVLESTKEKMKTTNMERYGVEHAMQNKEIHDKVVNTNLSRYGVGNTFLINNISCSSQQKHIHSLVGGILNFKLDLCALDIAFPEEMIYLEYDGSGHDLDIKFGNLTEEEFLKKERNRYYYVKSKGWKCIRLISKKDCLPNDDKIIELIFEAKKLLLNTNKNNIIYNFSEENSEELYGELNKIKSIKNP